MKRVLFSSATDRWATPRAVFDAGRTMALIERIARLEAKTEPNQAELRANVNQDACGIWKRRAWDMKRKLDALQGGSTEWIDVTERRKVVPRLEGDR